MVEIRKVQEMDAEAVWQIFHEVVAEGDAFCSDESVSREQALNMWLTDDTYVALVEGQIAGAYSLFPIHSGHGSHITGAAYMVSSRYRGTGVGLALGHHSLEKAKEKGYLAMQFNCVVSTNEAALALWKKLGFKIIGTVPKGFQHPKCGLVDTHILHRFL
jgi:L-amino acid N-acyltransferase YncA